MAEGARRRNEWQALRHALFGACAAVLMIAVSGCTSTTPTVAVAEKPRSKEYFSAAEYGVQASPRVTTMRTRLPRGGGRDQVGKPYKIKGKWYYPKEDRDYRKSGMASWYGDAFHGRLTANGEIYDMTHLTAAHPTMPLPSYARVTNKANGASVLVRVNDRGPYAHGRIIDLSRRAAELLDYTHSGVAKVEVEFVGRAPLDGQDDEFLMASYRPGNRAPDPSDGLPTGVMIAMNGPTPTLAAGASFPGTLHDTARAAAPASSGDPVLPDFGPIAPERPGIGLANRLVAPASLAAYADQRVAQASGVVAAFAAPGGTDGAAVAALNDISGGKAAYIAAGTYPDRASAERLAAALSDRAIVEIEADPDGGAYSVVLRKKGHGPLDDLLRAAWEAGASDAMTVRD